MVADYKDGITSKDALEIISGTLTITAADDGIVGKDSVCIQDGTIRVCAADDAVKSTNTEDTTKGYVVVDGGTLYAIGTSAMAQGISENSTQAGIVDNI